MADETKKVSVTDGLSNVITNLGILNKDKRTGARFDELFLFREDVDPIYQSSDVAARIIDRPPEEMTREGFKVIVDGKEMTEEIQVIFEDLGLDKKIEQALKWARLYGGAGLIMGAKDGQQPDQPVNWKGISTLDYVTGLDRYRLRPSGTEQIDGDVTSKNFGKPVFYTLQNLQYTSTSPAVALPKIHYTRVIRFEGIPVSWQQEARVDWWGDSILSRLLNPIMNYGLAHDSAALIVQDYTQLLVKLKNLSDMIASGEEALVQKRLQMVAFSASIINALVVEEGEEIERKTTNVSGLPELLKMINSRLVAATDLPHTILLGESPDGSNATGNATTLQWYDHVKNKQESVLRPILKQVLTFIFAAKDGPTKGVIPKDFTIEFNPLWQMSEKEQADIHFVQAQADAIYLDRAVLDPDEVADSRFGSGQFSIETTLDGETREAVEKPPTPGDQTPNQAGG